MIPISGRRKIHMRSQRTTERRDLWDGNGPIGVFHSVEHARAFRGMLLSIRESWGIMRVTPTNKSMATRVNLDAIIPRDDFDETVAASRSPGTRKDKLSVGDLVLGEFFFGALRKPDFQRETSEWDPLKIVSLIESFLAGDLIPAVILWQSKNNLHS